MRRRSPPWRTAAIPTRHAGLNHPRHPNPVALGGLGRDGRLPGGDEAAAAGEAAEPGEVILGGEEEGAAAAGAVWTGHDQSPGARVRSRSLAVSVAGQG